MGNRRNHIKQTVPLKDRLASFAKELREKASTLPSGADKDDLIKRAHSADTAADIDDWANSSKLQPPK